MENLSSGLIHDDGYAVAPLSFMVGLEVRVLLATKVLRGPPVQP